MQLQCSSSQVDCDLHLLLPASPAATLALQLLLLLDTVIPSLPPVLSQLVPPRTAHLPLLPLQEGTTGLDPLNQTFEFQTPLVQYRTIPMAKSEF